MENGFLKCNLFFFILKCKSIDKLGTFDSNIVVINYGIENVGSDSDIINGDFSLGVGYC